MSQHFYVFEEPAGNFVMTPSLPKDIVPIARFSDREEAQAFRAKCKRDYLSSWTDENGRELSLFDRVLWGVWGQKDTSFHPPASDSPEALETATKAIALNVQPAV
jgi:hypothetical protein